MMCRTPRRPPGRAVSATTGLGGWLLRATSTLLTQGSFCGRVGEGCGVGVWVRVGVGVGGSVSGMMGLGCLLRAALPLLCLRTLLACDAPAHATCCA